MRSATLFILGLLMTFLVLGFLYLGAARDFSSAKEALLYTVAVEGALVLVALGLFWRSFHHKIPELVEDQADKQIKSVASSLSDRYRGQIEALQKVISSYSRNDFNERITILNHVIEMDPTVYNVYISLGYAYWYGKNDLLKAEECFRKDLEYHPNNFQSAYELTALYASQMEWLSALSWMKEAVLRNPTVWKDFECDARLDDLRTKRRDEYQQIIEEAKRRPNGASQQKRNELFQEPTLVESM